MPRLRRVVNSKYSVEDEDIPLDTQDQDALISGFKEKVPFNKTRPRNKLDNQLIRVMQMIQGAFLVVNLILITNSYYRRENPLLSCVSCVLILGLAILIHVEFVKPRELCDTISNKQLLVANLVLSGIVFVVKLRTYSGIMDALFFVPFVTGLSLFSLLQDIKSLSLDILELEQLKFNYKEA
ncbi:hypothetical protein OGAPHI_002605 [Ogataea philodendri]|uniref:Uncharacterized protein n=1 Tax=Ogataea philodendri TaxID=1378263 RepID=A0A9P8PBX0_9ASCO|nr:uncharacterized protein OGAPHI_002605 [Ogataea philodendri]KAH3668850.1 hypothetical protein OGAPHI_002605 [Ogataea philodendri]